MAVVEVGLKRWLLSNAEGACIEAPYSAEGGGLVWRGSVKHEGALAVASAVLFILFKLRTAYFGAL